MHLEQRPNHPVTLTQHFHTLHVLYFLFIDNNNLRTHLLSKNAWNKILPTPQPHSTHPQNHQSHSSPLSNYILEPKFVKYHHLLQE